MGPFGDYRFFFDFYYRKPGRQIQDSTPLEPSTGDFAAEPLLQVRALEDQLAAAAELEMMPVACGAGRPGGTFFFCMCFMFRVLWWFVQRLVIHYDMTDW